MNREVHEVVGIKIMPSEKKAFWDIIESEGYEKSPEGVKAFILETGPENGTPENEASSRLAEKIQQLIRENPQEVKAIKKHGRKLVRTVLKRFKL